jgi:hypothetical protein
MILVMLISSSRYSRHPPPAHVSQVHWPAETRAGLIVGDHRACNVQRASFIYDQGVVHQRCPLYSNTCMCRATWVTRSRPSCGMEELGKGVRVRNISQTSLAVQTQQCLLFEAQDGNEQRCVGPRKSKTVERRQRYDVRSTLYCGKYKCVVQKAK